MRIIVLLAFFLVLVVPVLGQQPAATPSPSQTPSAGLVAFSPQVVPAELAAKPTAAPHKPFRLDIALVVKAEAPGPESAEALRGQLQFISAMRRGWYTGPGIQGPIFQYWNAADYTPAASNTYHGVPYYMREKADYYIGPAPGMAQDLSVGQIIGGMILQGLMTGNSRR